MSDTPCHICVEANIGDYCYHSRNAVEIAEALTDAYQNPPPNASLGWIDQAEELSGLFEPPYEVQILKPADGMTGAFVINGSLVVSQDGDDVFVALDDVAITQEAL